MMCRPAGAMRRLDPDCRSVDVERSVDVPLLEVSARRQRPFRIAAPLDLGSPAVAGLRHIAKRSSEEELLLPSRLAPLPC